MVVAICVLEHKLRVCVHNCNLIGYLPVFFFSIDIKKRQNGPRNEINIDHSDNFFLKRVRIPGQLIV